MAKPAIYELSASMASPLDPEPVTVYPIVGSEFEPDSEANLGSEPKSEPEPMVTPVTVEVAPNPDPCEYGGVGVEVIMGGE